MGRTLEGIVRLSGPVLEMNGDGMNINLALSGREQVHSCLLVNAAVSV